MRELVIVGEFAKMCLFAFEDYVTDIFGNVRF